MSKNETVVHMFSIMAVSLSSPMDSLQSELLLMQDSVVFDLCLPDTRGFEAKHNFWPLTTARFPVHECLLGDLTSNTRGTIKLVRSAVLVRVEGFHKASAVAWISRTCS